MEFRVLHAAVVKPETPRCEAMRKTPYANDHIKTDYQCSFVLRLHTEGLFQ